MSSAFKYVNCICSIFLTSLFYFQTSYAATPEAPENPYWVAKALAFSEAAQRHSFSQATVKDRSAPSQPVKHDAVHLGVGLLISMQNDAYQTLKTERLDALAKQRDYQPAIELLNAFNIISDSGDYDAALLELDAVSKRYNLSPDEHVIHAIFKAYTYADKRDVSAALNQLSNAIPFKEDVAPYLAYQLLHAELFLFHRANDFDRAIDKAFEILAFTEAEDIPFNPQTLVNKFANALRQNKFLTEAASVNKVAREISLETKSEFYIFLSHYVCGMIASDQGRNDQAISCFETAYPLRDSLSERKLDFLFHYSKASARAGNVKVARDLFQATKDNPRFDGYVKLHSDMNRFEAELLFREGRSGAAYEALTLHYDTYLDNELIKQSEATAELKRFTDKESAWLREKANVLAHKDALQNRIISRQRVMMVLSALFVIGMLGFAHLQRLSAQKLKRARGKTILANEAIRREARTDQLTRIGNRRAFYEACQAFSESPQDSSLALAILDLDGFKQVNDTFGHEMGDLLIKETSQRLDKALAGKGQVFRLGGDEFALIYMPEDDERLTLFQACINKALKDPLVVESKSLDLNWSVGAVKLEGANLDISTSLNHADYALYQAKKLTGSGFHIFSDADLTRINEENRIAEEVLWNLETGSFIMFGQIVVNSTNGSLKPYGVEALIRAQTRSGDVINPETFVWHAVSSGKVDLLTKSTLLKSIEMMRKSGLECPLLFNLSREQITGADVLKVIAQTLEETNFPANHLIVELSEETLNHDLMLASETLNVLKQLGVQIALDDFGTANTGFSTLLKFDFDLIKTDRNLLTSAMEFTRTEHVFANLINLSQKLNIPCIVEGLETQAEVSFVKKLGGNILQGYMFGRPAEIPKFRPYSSPSNSPTLASPPSKSHLKRSA